MQRSQNRSAAQTARQAKAPMDSEKRARKRPANPEQPLPAQQPIDDDAPVAVVVSRWKIVLKRVLTIFLLLVALALAYVFLLLGEPDAQTASQTATETAEKISVPMAAVEIGNADDVPDLAAAFGEPVLNLSSELTFTDATLHDTAFEGAYARRVTFTYAFQDGTQFVLESIRPAMAARLLYADGYALRVDKRYAMAGMDAARMDSSSGICVFAKGESAVYAVTCPLSHEEELPALLKQTSLMVPAQ